MAAALAAAGRDDSAGARVASLRDRLAQGLLSSVPGTARTGASDAAPGFCHVRFAGLEGEALVVLLDQAGVSVSAGAACSSGAVEASHVLAAMGFDRAEAGSGIRFSLGWTTTEEDIDRVLSVVPGVIARLRD
jgi:cysteine desulfurase